MDNKPRSAKHNKSILGVVSSCIMMMLSYLVKSAIFETAALAMAGILGYFVVYRWFRR
jgi:hypothetical protein